MDEVDFKLLNIIQEGIPVVEHPFHEIAEDLGIEPEEVVDRINNIKDSGYIRRVGAIFDSAKMGYHSNLVGMEVPENRLGEVVTVINDYDEVTHNYYRKNGHDTLENNNAHLNVWFTLSTRSDEEERSILEDISLKSGIDKLYEFPKLKLFKLKVYFEMGGSECLMK